MFAAPTPPKEHSALTDEVAAKEPGLRYELLRRRAAAKIEMGTHAYPEAAADLKGALKLRPGDQPLVSMARGGARTRAPCAAGPRVRTRPGACARRAPRATAQAAHRLVSCVRACVLLHR